MCEAVKLWTQYLAYSKCSINAGGTRKVTVFQGESYVSLSLFLPSSKVNSGKQGTFLLFCIQPMSHICEAQKTKGIRKGWDWKLGKPGL